MNKNNLSGLVSDVVKDIRDMTLNNEAVNKMVRKKLRERMPNESSDLMTKLKWAGDLAELTGERKVISGDKAKWMSGASSIEIAKMTADNGQGGKVYIEKILGIAPVTGESGVIRRDESWGWCFGSEKADDPTKVIVLVSPRMDKVKLVMGGDPRHPTDSIETKISEMPPEAKEGLTTFLDIIIAGAREDL